MALHDFVDALNFLTGSKLLQVASFIDFVYLLEILYVFIYNFFLVRQKRGICILSLLTVLRSTGMTTIVCCVFFLILMSIQFTDMPRLYTGLIIFNYADCSCVFIN